MTPAIPGMRSHADRWPGASLHWRGHVRFEVLSRADWRCLDFEDAFLARSHFLAPRREPHAGERFPAADIMIGHGVDIARCRWLHRMWAKAIFNWLPACAPCLRG